MAQIVLLNASTASHHRSLGAYRTATELRKHGFTVQVIEYVDYLTAIDVTDIWDLLVKFLDPGTLWVGVSSTFQWNLRQVRASNTINPMTLLGLPRATLDIGSLEETVLKALIKSVAPYCTLVCGGARAYQRPSPSFYDVYMLGYSEVHAVDYSKWRTSQPNGFQFKRESAYEYMVVDYAPRAEGFDFTTSTTDWSQENLAVGESLPIEIGRGCIFKCKFCSYPMTGKKKLDYIKDTTVLRSELVRNYELHGTTNYLFVDDTYNDSLEKLRRLEDEVWSKLDFKIKYTAYLRLDLLAAFPEEIDLLKSSGLVGCFFGIESLNAKASRLVGKGIEKARAFETLQKCRDSWGNQVQIAAGVILGLPYDTEETIQQWLSEFAATPNIDYRSIQSLSLRPEETKTLWTSEFDLHYSDYGYVINRVENGIAYWSNTKTGTSKLRMEELVLEHLAKYPQTSVGGFTVSTLLGLGYSQEEIRAYKTEGGFTNETRERARYRRENYWQRLLTQSNIAKHSH
jgi:hypothetical protein